VYLQEPETPAVLPGQPIDVRLHWLTTCHIWYAVPFSCIMCRHKYVTHGADVLWTQMPGDAWSG